LRKVAVEGRVLHAMLEHEFSFFWCRARLLRIPRLTREPGKRVALSGCLKQSERISVRPANPDFLILDFLIRDS
jgi:hypothetical protein